MFLALLLIGGMFIVGAGIARGPRVAAAVAAAAVLLMPIWLVQDFGAILLNLRVCYAIIGVGCVALHPQTVWRIAPLASDYLVAALVVAQTVTEMLTSEATTTVGVEIALQWLAPYVLGRVVWRNADDGRRLAVSLAHVGAALSVWSIVESVTHVNLINSALGYAGSLQSQNDIRWGLRRAEGPLTHPIFFGVQLVLMTPFALESARRAVADGKRAWRQPSLWLAAAGIVCTMSRGPQLGMFAVAIATAAYAVPRWRPAVVTPVVLFVGILVAAPGLAIDVLHRWSGEASHMTIEIKGEEVAYTGTMHRLLQVRVYEESLAQVGWFGYGSAAMRAGANQIPHVEDHLRKMFSSIDNHYLHFTLQCGYVGLGLFAGLMLTAVVYAAVSVRRGDSPTPWLAAGTAAALAAVTVMLGTVWLAGDIRFALLLTVGMAGGMYASCKPAVVAAQPARASVRQRIALPWLRLVPGHSS